MSLEIILCEFGKRAPDVSQFRRYFPDATISVYGDGDCDAIFDRSHPRFGWRMNDYWKARKLYESKADVAIAFDADMRIVSADVRALPLFARTFGLCLPANPRHLVRVDTLIGADSDGVLDETNGTGYALNCTPIVFGTHDDFARGVIQNFMRLMEEKPVRGPVAWWRACYMQGFSPYLLPPQWCVCEADIGCGNEIILHEGHDKVRKYYSAVRAS